MKQKTPNTERDLENEASYFLILNLKIKINPM